MASQLYKQAAVQAQQTSEHGLRSKASIFNVTLSLPSRRTPI